MEMQQLEFFAARPVKHFAAPHLRLVQTSEIKGIFCADRVVAKRHGSSAPASDLATVPRQAPQAPRQAPQAPRQAPQAPRQARRPSQAGLKAIAPEHVERFLNQLHGEALLVGALSYDLGLRLSQLRFLRVRDVNLSARIIELSDGTKEIPSAVFDDLKDHISEKMLAVGAGAGVRKRDQLLFSHQAFEHVLRTCASFFVGAQREVGNHDIASDLTTSALSTNQAAELGQRARDNLLRVMGWFHTKKAMRRGGRIQSPLGLFDKGPKIVRRDRGGAVHSYYLWRAVHSR